MVFPCVLVEFNIVTNACNIYSGVPCWRSRPCPWEALPPTAPKTRLYLFTLLRFGHAACYWLGRRRKLVSFSLACYFEGTGLSYEVSSGNSAIDVLGRLVVTLVDEVMPSGHYEVHLDGGNLPSGTYIIRMDTGHQQRSRIVQLIK